MNPPQDRSNFSKQKKFKKSPVRKAYKRPLFPSATRLLSVSHSFALPPLLNSLHPPPPFYNVSKKERRSLPRYISPLSSLPNQDLPPPKQVCLDGEVPLDILRDAVSVLQNPNQASHLSPSALREMVELIILLKSPLSFLFPSTS